VYPIHCDELRVSFDEVKQLRREAQDLKEVVAEQALELWLLKKSMIGDGGDQT
jgi:transposase